MLSGSGEEATENGMDLEDDSSEIEMEAYMRDRRRAKSLPAYPEQATLFDEIGISVRKRVKFADSMGLNLASVKHFSTAEDILIPSKVFSSLQSFPLRRDREFVDLGDLCVKFNSALTMDRLVPTFKMPVESDDFEARVRTLHVILEKVTITQFDIRGQIRVDTQNCHRTGDVGVRYTLNDWLSSVDAQAIVMPGDDALGERFAFTLYTPPFLDPSSSVHFAVYLKNDNGEFWDNNDGMNYTLKYHCMPTHESAAFHAT